MPWLCHVCVRRTLRVCSSYALTARWRCRSPMQRRSRGRRPRAPSSSPPTSPPRSTPQPPPISRPPAPRSLCPAPASPPRAAPPRCSFTTKDSGQGPPKRFRPPPKASRSRPDRTQQARRRGCRCMWLAMEMRCPQPQALLSSPRSRNAAPHCKKRRCLWRLLPQQPRTACLAQHV